MSLIGTHVAVAGGLVKTGLREADEAGAEIIQLFAGNPRSWAPRAANPAADEAFRAGCAERALPVVVHAPHLINLGAPSELVLSRSLAALELTLQRASDLGAFAVVVHAGSSVTPGRRTTALAALPELISPLVDRADPSVRLLIEPTAGAGESMASTIGSTVEYVAALNDERVGLCLDTCHLHAAGEDLADPRLIDDLADAVALIHVNDSRDPRGSHRDRHESLNEGTIGLPTLAAFLAHPALAEVPMLVETPTHQRDVTLLKSITDKGTLTEFATTPKS
ncbi:deoxyribonuclease IV [Kribbella sp. NPDC051620]|uniref:deoxyribonuclease IV n=1 Tax=Kribbella sp. NPDC051620 TaxID=3364120 RepID=UPI0037B71CAF